MEDIRRNIQKADRQRGCGMVDSRNTTGMLLDRQRRGNIRCNKFRQNRLEWRC
tara:strand:+ start:134 stop:292 length:159 start_codon:yes stop_codon:yes gene_type:complete